MTESPDECVVPFRLRFSAPEIIYNEEDCELVDRPLPCFSAFRRVSVHCSSSLLDFFKSDSLEVNVDVHSSRGYSHDLVVCFMIK